MSLANYPFVSSAITIVSAVTSTTMAYIKSLDGSVTKEDLLKQLEKNNYMKHRK